MRNCTLMADDKVENSFESNDDLINKIRSSNFNPKVEIFRFKITEANRDANTKVLSASFKRDKTTINELVNEYTLHECNASSLKIKLKLR